MFVQGRKGVKGNAQVCAVCAATMQNRRATEHKSLAKVGLEGFAEYVFGDSNRDSSRDSTLQNRLAERPLLWEIVLDVIEI